jgi:O-antigen/teichoic acid export membrane protein
MTSQSRAFYLKILWTDVIVILIAAVIYLYVAPIHAYAMVSATVITTINTLIGFYFIQKYIHASTEDFNSYVYGSTFGRMIGMMIVIGAILLFSNFPQITFILSLFISYIYKSVLEIIFIHKNSTQRHEKS